MGNLILYEVLLCCAVSSNGRRVPALGDAESLSLLTPCSHDLRESRMAKTISVIDMAELPTVFPR